MIALLFRQQNTGKQVGTFFVNEKQVHPLLISEMVSWFGQREPSILTLIIRNQFPSL